MNSDTDNYASESYSQLAYEDKQFTKIMVTILLVLGVIILVLIAANAVSGYTASLVTSSSSSALADSDVDNIIEDVANRSGSADDLVQNATTLFAAGSITNPDKCYTDATYDSFGSSTFDSNGLTINTYDSTKWYVNATVDSTFVNQNGFAIYLTEGNNVKGSTNVISNKQITGDFNISIDLRNLPKGSTGWLAYRIGVWFGLKDYSLYAFRDQSNDLQIFLGYWDGTQLQYFNPTGGYSYSSSGFKIPVKDENLAITLQMKRVGSVLTTTVENDNEIQTVGVINDAPIDDVYLVHGLNVGNTTEIQAAVADNFRINSGCFK